LAEELCSGSWTGNLVAVIEMLSQVKYRRVINIPNNRGKTAGDTVVIFRGQPALYCASRQGHLDIVIQLILSGADVNLPVAEHGGTPLHGRS
jgi:hypothetical protein